jgi:type IV fimbrial biogenesis protein FimU
LQVTAAGAVLRKIPAMSGGATLLAGNVTAMEFNNLGGLTTPASAVAMTYTRGSITRTVNICLTGRITVNGNSPCGT